ncbi:hypothetical protein I3842_01G037900 [Carya illinoinensis]|uniref:Uncharacterized protein n=1 Tax=Carya illinoinensis TaxID=32201 RepID=A0A922FZE3_CARIL|nr:hypothetical protein I3842_01G037900 [Carya illinoinensis]
MEVPWSRCWDDKGFVDKVVVTVSLLSHGLRLSFCRPLHDILDLLCLVPVQLHPFESKAYFCACIVFNMVLEPLGNLYSDLTAWKLLALYNVRAHIQGNVVNFYKKDNG